MFNRIVQILVSLIKVFRPLHRFLLRIIHIFLLVDRIDDLKYHHYPRNELDHISLFNLLRYKHFIGKLSIDNVPFIMIEMSFS